MNVGDRVEVLVGHGSAEGEVAVTGTVTGFVEAHYGQAVVVTDDSGFEYDAGFNPSCVRLADPFADLARRLGPAVDEDDVQPL